MRLNLALEQMRERRRARSDAASPEYFAITRRTFFGVSAGAFGAAAIPISARALSIEANPALAIVRLGSIEAWRIDPTWFAGNPQLRVTETPRRIHIRLKDARYPGTNVSADLDCDCRWSFRGWAMHLRLGTFEGSGLLMPWLAREAVLTASLGPLGEIVRHPRAIGIASASEQRATFTPDWLLRVEGTPLQLTVAAADQACASAAVGLLDPRQHATRSTIHVQRGEHAWKFVPPMRVVDAGTLFTFGSLFEAAEIETSESSSGDVQVALSAHAPGEGKLAYHPGSRFTAPDGNAVVLPLRDVDYAAVATDASIETALVAGFARAPQWIRTAGAALQVGDAGDANAFELLDDAGGSSLLCAPRLLSSLVSLEGVLTEALAPQVPMQIALAGTAPEGTASVLPCKGEEGVEVCLPNCCIAVTRPEDLLALCFEFQNLRLRKRPFRKAILERCNNEDAYVIVHFPPQHIAEEALPEDTTTAPPADVRPVASRAARPSRLAFRLKPGTNDIDYTLDSLLNWQQFDAALLPLERSWRHIREPEPTETSIEFPYRIKLSPEEAARWIHSSKPVARDGRVELWHTRLTVDGPSVPRVSAVWSPDYRPGQSRPDPNDPFPLSVSNRDRHDIVVASHDSLSCPEPIPAPLFMLSSLGAWSDLKGEWQDQTGNRCIGNSLEKWEHVATMGRDQRVVIAKRGFLYPFGHRAVMVKETERRVHPVSAADGSVSFIAYLRIRIYIELREPVKNYADDPLLSFVQVEFLDQRSPLLDLVIINNVVFPVGGVPKCTAAGGNWLDEVFWPTVQKKPYRFRLASIDKARNRVLFDAPVIFVENDPTLLATYREAASCAYRDNTNLAHRTSLLDGQKVGLATSFEKGDTEIQGQNVVFIGDDVAPEEASGFKPHIDTISGRVPALDQFVPGGSGRSTTFKLVDPELTTSQLFAEIVNDAPNTSFSSSSDRSGGVAAPSVNVTHLSRRFGPVGKSTTAPSPGAPASAAAAGIESFKASDFFGNDANILGQIPLSAIVPDMLASSLDAVPAIRSLLTEWRDGPPQLSQTISWSTALKPFPDPPSPPFSFTPRGPLVLNGRFDAWIGTTIQPRFEMTGTLSDFTIELSFAGIGIGLVFNRLVFRASSDGSTDIVPEISKVDFLGALKFIQDLAEKFTKPAGFNISLLPGAVMVQAPPINLGKLSVGAFAFENLNITTWVTLPFTPVPVEFGFAVARPDKPFLVTVGIYSGGGHFAITLDSSGNGVRHLRAAIEFGAQKEISFGSVAHGRLYVFGGIYYEQNGREMKFRAYVRAGGEIEALGLISMGIELYLGLEYQPATGNLFGTARMTYSFSIGFVKKSFSITYQQRFAGSGSSSRARLEPSLSDAPVALGVAMDPVDDRQQTSEEGRRVRITDTLDPDRWNAYWTAFA